MPRYWLAHMLFRAAGLRLGYVETYGGLFLGLTVRPAATTIQVGIRTPSRRRPDHPAIP